MRTRKEILISLEVAKCIENDRQSFEETEDDILRRKYGLPRAPRPDTHNGSGTRPLVCRGGRIPHGTKLLADYKGRPWSAKVENGRIFVEGNPNAYNSPTAAASSITKGNVNGWWFWEYEIEPGKRKLLSWIRRPSQQQTN